MRAVKREHLGGNIEFTSVCFVHVLDVIDDAPVDKKDELFVGKGSGPRRNRIPEGLEERDGRATACERRIDDRLKRPGRASREVGRA